MNALTLTAEALVFCLVTVVFLLIFKLKSMLVVSKQTIAAYVIACVGIISTAVSSFTAESAVKTLCYGICTACYAAAIGCLLENKNVWVRIAAAVFSGLVTFGTLYAGLSAATYLITLTVIVCFVFDQFRLIRTDNLTGLYNLYGRKLEMEEQERQYKRDHSDSFYVFSCDLDKFKTINDTWGHKEGDRALSLVAKALTKVANAFDAKVFRVGGDEFQIIADTSDKAEAERIEQALQREFDAIRFRDDFDIEISVGKVLYKGEAEPEDILEEADSLLYAAKRERK